jgi:hypothetical protein
VHELALIRRSLLGWGHEILGVKLSLAALGFWEGNDTTRVKLAEAATAPARSHLKQKSWLLRNRSFPQLHHHMCVSCSVSSSRSSQYSLRAIVSWTMRQLMAGLYFCSGKRGASTRTASHMRKRRRISALIAPSTWTSCLEQFQFLQALDRQSALGSTGSSDWSTSIRATVVTATSGRWTYLMTLEQIERLSGEGMMFDFLVGVVIGRWTARRPAAYAPAAA